jgi:16S rRNA (cytidine1402-2'-O)-methyltransferase
LNSPGTLFLLPTLLGDDASNDWLCQKEFALFEEIKVWFTENERSARRFLRKAGFKGDFDEMVMERLDKDTPSAEIETMLKHLLEGKDAAILSEAGCPGIADPGSNLVRGAQKKRIPVVAIPGPSAIVLTLMASGFNGQQFTFHGYLPVDTVQRSKRIRELENLAKSTGYTQIFIETPYRNNGLLADILKCCQPETPICIGVNITLSDGYTKTMSVRNWQKEVPELHKLPAVFAIG